MIAGLLRHRRVVGAVVIGLIACVVIGAVVIDRMSRKTYFCAGMGIIDAPSASTPEAALAAYLGGDAGDWKRGDHRVTEPDSAMNVAPYESYDFTPTRSVASPEYSLVTVRFSSGLWSASGACVATPLTGK